MIKEAEEYAGISNINTKNYKTALLVRVNPYKIRYCKEKKEYWDVDGTIDTIPY